jgi:rhodanese-related sulfurtransferase
MSTGHKQHNPGFLKLVNDAKGRVKQVDIEQYQKMLADGHVLGDGHILIDTREDHEWTAGHAAGAIHLSKGVIERDIESEIPDKSTTMVLYCGGGYRSALVADALQTMGYKNAISLDGGWRAWNTAGLPVEKP